MGRLENKIAVVTGSATGIGAGTVKLYAKEGATVITKPQATVLAAFSCFIFSLLAILITVQGGR